MIGGCSIFDYMSNAESDFFMRRPKKENETGEDMIARLKRIHAQKCGIKTKKKTEQGEIE
jgi:hypothetical protein